MVFSSPTFLFLFLPLVLVCTLWGGARLQNVVLLGWSFVFYYYGGGSLVFLLLLSCLVNWAFGLALERKASRSLLPLALAFNIGLLAYFKYAGFMAAQFNELSEYTGVQIVMLRKVTLPIGISFFTFQGMSYIIDVWRGEMKAFRNPLDILLCVSFFPHLIAGPIVRLSHLEGQLRRRSRTLEDFVIGAARFTWGLSKKVLIADICGAVANAGFDSADLATLTHSPPLPPGAAWLALLAYTLQIYFDFSGYSDMAIGLARMVGFRFPENFRHPYSAVSVTDFWRRWHMSLSTWFRDYLYIPLGGNRGSPWRVYRNLLIVFFITGLWHGASWTFILWGLYHGVFLMLERATGLARMEEHRWAVPRRAGTLLVIMGSWILFRAPSLTACRAFLTSMFVDLPHSYFPVTMSMAMDLQTFLAMGLGMIAFFAPREMTTGTFLEAQRTWPERARAAVLLALFPVTMVQVLSSDYSPFLYFQF